MAWRLSLSCCRTPEEHQHVWFKLEPTSLNGVLEKEFPGIQKEASTLASLLLFAPSKPVLETLKWQPATRASKLCYVRSKSTWFLFKPHPEVEFRFWFSFSKRFGVLHCFPNVLLCFSELLEDDVKLTLYDDAPAPPGWPDYFGHTSTIPAYAAWHWRFL